MFVQEAERRMLESAGYRTGRPSLFPKALPSGAKAKTPRSASAGTRPSRTRIAAASALRRVADAVEPGLAPRAERRVGA
jgi:hypothetical protein